MLKAILILGFAVGAWADCGSTPVQPSEDRIVGGSVATPYSWPWQVEFCSQGWFTCSLMCGGSVLNENWVMTAGHCVYGNTNKPGNYKIKAGVFKKGDNNEAGEQVVKIDSIYLNPKYDHNSVSHDIALLKLATPLKMSDHIQPVCLASEDKELTTGTMVTVTGWGTLASGALTTPSQLHQVQVPMVDMATCQKDYGSSAIEPDVMFCAGVTGKDSCQGDSGGPVVLKHSDGKYYQHGIVSWGKGCAAAGYPGVYSRVSAYCDFIKTTTNGEVSC